MTAELGWPPPDCAAVEDSSNGLRSAAAAGLWVIAIPQPEYPPDPDALAQASLVLPNLAGLTADAVAALAVGHLNFPAPARRPTRAARARPGPAPRAPVRGETARRPRP